MLYEKSNKLFLCRKNGIYFIFYFYLKFVGMGIGDWGLGIGDWGLGPIPNPQSPIPNPHKEEFTIIVSLWIFIEYLKSKTNLGCLFKFIRIL